MTICPSLAVNSDRISLLSRNSIAMRQALIPLHQQAKPGDPNAPAEHKTGPLPTAAQANNNNQARGLLHKDTAASTLSP